MNFEELKKMLNEFSPKKAVDSYKPGTTTTSTDSDSDAVNNVGRTAATTAAGAIAKKVVGAVAGRAGVAGLLYPDSTASNDTVSKNTKPDFSHGEPGTAPKPKSVTEPPKAADTTPNSASTTTPKSTVSANTSTGSSSSPSTSTVKAPESDSKPLVVDVKKRPDPVKTSSNEPSFGQAFKAAREKAGNSTGSFTWKGKTYQTNRAGEKYVSKSKQTPVKEETLEEAKSPWREHRDATVYHKNEAKKANKAGDSQLAKQHSEAADYHDKAYYEHESANHPVWVETGKAKGTPGAREAASSKARAASAAIKKPVKEETMSENKLIAAVLNLTSESKSDNLFADQAKSINEAKKKSPTGGEMNDVGDHEWAYPKKDQRPHEVVSLWYCCRRNRHSIWCWLCSRHWRCCRLRSYRGNRLNLWRYLRHRRSGRSSWFNWLDLRYRSWLYLWLQETLKKSHT